MTQRSFVRATCVLVGLGWLTFCVQLGVAQTTAFTYQGKLTDAGNPANGNYDLQFKLFDTVMVGTGAQAGATLVRNPVAASTGVFTVTLDFTANVFSGADRYLEIGVRPAGSANPYTTLAPRQPLTSTPYAIRSLAATAADGLSVACVNCIPSSQIQTVQGAQVTGQLPVASIPAGSGNYLQNTTTQQANANFNISGNGTTGGTLAGNVVNTATQYDIGGSRVLSNAGTRNVFAGAGAGQANTLGTDNAFFGYNAGLNNTGNLTIGGRSNSFFGANAGQLLTQGRSNSFFGASAGGSSTAGFNNSFFGAGVGSGNAGDDNAFFGASAGQINKGNRNSFFGVSAGRQSFFGDPDPPATGDDNAFFGISAGAHNTAGNNSFFGSGTGVANTTGGENSFFGKSAGAANTEGNFNSFFGTNAGINNTVGFYNTIIGHAANVGAGALFNATAIGAGAVVTTINRIQLGRNTIDTVAIGVLSAASGATHVCINNGVLAFCSSSLRYKEDVQPLRHGLNLLQRLRPVSFKWKERDERDFGLIAEEVAAVEPLMVTHNHKGEIEGVKYDQLSVVLINAVKAQQAQLETQAQEIAVQQARLNRQQQQLDALTKLVCQTNPQAAACQE